MNAAPRDGLLLFAHGARDARWAEPFDAVARRVAALRPEAEVRLAFLELMPPTLAEAGTAMVASGCTRIEVVPLFLGTGGHVRRDLPAQLERLAAAHPGIAWRLGPAIGERAEVIEAIAGAAARGAPLETDR